MPLECKELQGVRARVKRKGSKSRHQKMSIEITYEYLKEREAKKWKGIALSGSAREKNPQNRRDSYI